MKKLISVLLATILMGTALTACTSSAPASSTAAPANSTASASAAAPAESSDDPIIIGIVNDLSGNRSINGNAITNGAKLAIKEINAAGGILGRQVKTVIYDNKNDSTESINAYTRLADLDKASVVITSDASSVCLSLVEISNSKKIPLVGMPSDPRATMDLAAGTPNRYMFLVDQPNAPQQAQIMASYLEKETKLRKAAVFYDQSNAYTVTNSEAFIKIWSEIGEVTTVETCNANDQDYKTQLSKIKNSGAEFIYCPNMPAQLVMMVQQANQIGLKIPYTGALDMADPFLSLLNDPKSLDLAYFQAVAWLGDEKLQKFSADYKAEYNENIQIKSINGYDAAYIVKAAIESAGSSDPEAIRDALENGINGLSNLLVTDNYSHDPTMHTPKDLGMVICKIEKGELSKVDYYLPN